MALLFVASVLLIPYGAMQERSHNLFGLNAPSWSLFWEYVANLIFGLVLYRTGRKTLAALTVLAAALLCWTGYRAGDLSGGWSSRNFWDGGVRVAFSFCAGLLVYRSGWRPRLRLSFVGLGLLLVLALVMPYARGAWVREAAVVILYFPLLVALGAGAEVTPRMERLCRISGELSYPLYMTHYAVIWIWGDLARKHNLAARGFGTAAAFGVLSMVAVGWTTLELYDEPLRAYLRKPRRGGFLAVARNSSCQTRLKVIEFLAMLFALSSRARRAFLGTKRVYSSLLSEFLTNRHRKKSID